MSKGELARTRIMQVAPDQLEVGTPAMFTPRAMSERGVRAVGHFRHLANGEVAVPVVYVSKRAKRWPERHRKALIITGSALVFLSGLGFVIAYIGPAWFLGGIVAMAVTLFALSRVSRGGRTSVSVTTTTTTKVRVR